MTVLEKIRNGKGNNRYIKKKWMALEDVKLYKRINKDWKRNRIGEKRLIMKKKDWESNKEKEKKEK